MAFFLQFTGEQISQKPDIDEDLRTLLLQAGVHTSMPGIFLSDFEEINGA